MFTMFRSKKLFLSFVFIWSLLCLDTRSFTQQTGDLQGNVSESELRAFVKAYVNNQKIRQKYEPPLKASTDPEKKAQIHDEANAELKVSLAKQNLSIEHYNRIYNLVNNDERLRKKALMLIEEERQGSSKNSQDNRPARGNPRGFLVRHSPRVKALKLSLAFPA